MPEKTNTKTIAKNTMFLYFRMMFTMVISLYTSRVILQKLGVDDYGIYHAVGGIVGFLSFLNGAISTGKEANVLKGIKDDGSIVAVKIYRIATSDFKKMQYYIAGDPRFNVRSSNKRQLINNWVNKEYRNLTRLKDAGVYVPEAITSMSNVLIIEFIGDVDGNPAPTVKNLPPQDPEDFYEKLVNQMYRFINKANLIHGDLSTYNILNYNEEPVIIDVSQSVVRDHIIANELLERDIKNISFEFSKMGVDTSIEDLTERLIK